MTRISVPVIQYPSALREVIFALSRDRNLSGLSNETIRKITDPLGQLLYVARREGLDFNFTMETLAAFINDIDRRSIKHATRVTYMTGLRRLAVALEWDQGNVKRIDGEIKYYKNFRQSEVPEKELKLLRNPISARDIAEQANFWFRMSEDTVNLQRKRSNFQRAALLAILSIVPLRIGDVQHFRVNEDVFRTRDSWFVDTEFRKTGSMEPFPLAKILNPYLDALIHLGDPDNFEDKLKSRWNTPLFCKVDGNMLLRNTLWRHFSIATGGHSPHIVRTLAYDFFSDVDDVQASLIARIMCGHISLRISKNYEVHAKRARFANAQRALAESQERVLSPQ